MRKIFYVLAVLCFCTACQQKAGYTINGKVDGIADGDTVYLQDFMNRQLVKLDSAIVKNGTFKFTGNQESPVYRYITYIKGDKQYVADLFLENGKINVKLGEETSIGGTVNNDVYQKFSNDFIAAQKEMNDFYKAIQEDTTLSDEQRQAKMNELEAKEEKAMDMIYNTIEQNITNAVGIHLLPSYASAFSEEKQQALIEKVPAEMVNDNIKRIKDHLDLVAKTAVGQKFADFEMKTPEGNNVKLSDFVSKNKYTLVDFWASWCGPCRQEMPNVVEAYKTYKPKGFEIVGVSLDRDEESWKKGIAELNITWPQMSDVKYWDCEAAKLYGVNAIPATVLIDQEGTIVERNLRGEALKKRLAELFQ
jgi:peroxiredoxin